MNNTATLAPPPIGHNAQANLSEVLAEQYSELASRVDIMIERLEREAPEVVDNDRASGQCTDLYKDADTLAKEVEKFRTGEKAPFLEGGRKVDSFFHNLLGRVQKAAAPVHARATAYLVHKRNEAERKEREEAWRKREESGRLLREAAEAEEARQGAEAEAERKRKPQAKIAEAAGHGALAEQLRDRSAQALAESNAALDRLAQPSAEHARTRGASSVGTLQQVMAFEVVNFEAIPLEALRPYLEREAIDRAIKAYGVIHKRACLAGDGLTSIPGVRFFMRDKGHIR